MPSAKMQILANSIYFLPFYGRKVTKCQGEMENINVLVSTFCRFDHAITVVVFCIFL